MDEPSQLQIYAVEESTEPGGTCIARCVGGVARVGQVFTHEGTSEASVQDLRLTLDRIERYGRCVDFFGPPHVARVHLSGGSTSILVRGAIIASAPTAEPITESLEN
ncbi:hypothetical protein AB0D12_14685 [Streptomyces sp. NPDC048479]|uniref:hypothetical protein n=1 Tax=Streptomyces sp. NPDC048479 TaxID=3154725 RepID=UPI0034455545